MKIERDFQVEGDHCDKETKEKRKKKWRQELKYDGSALHECLKMMNQTLFST